MTMVLMIICNIFSDYHWAASSGQPNLVGGRSRDFGDCGIFDTIHGGRDPEDVGSRLPH